MATENEARRIRGWIDMTDGTGTRGQHAGGVADHEAQGMGEFERQKCRRPVLETDIQHIRGPREQAGFGCFESGDENSLVSRAPVFLDQGRAGTLKSRCRNGRQFLAGEDQVGESLQRMPGDMMRIHGQCCLKCGTRAGPVSRNSENRALESSPSLRALRAGYKVICVALHSHLLCETFIRIFEI